MPPLGMRHADMFRGEIVKASFQQSLDSILFEIVLRGKMCEHRCGYSVKKFDTVRFVDYGGSGGIVNE